MIARTTTSSLNQSGRRLYSARRAGCPGFRAFAGRCGVRIAKGGFCWRCWNLARAWAGTTEALL